jgi:hypothetical protein
MIVSSTTIPHAACARVFVFFSGKLEHRRSKQEGQSERVPQRAAVKAHPQNKDESGAN